MFSIFYNPYVIKNLILYSEPNNFLALKNNFNDLLDFNLKQKFKIAKIEQKHLSKQDLKGKKDL